MSDRCLERNQLQNADRLVAYSDQYDGMVVCLVSLYDTYLVGLFVRLTFPPHYSSVVEPMWCLVLLVSRMGITEVHQ